MSAEAPFLSRSWSVGQFTATLTIARPEPGRLASAVVEWEPARPERLSDAELADYTRGRNLAIRELSQSLGLRTLVLDV